MRDLYLIDGYNVIFGAPSEFSKNDLESSRKKLIDMLQDYGAHKDIEIIVVFDGQGISNNISIEAISSLFQIAFTPVHMTADSYIEKESYRRRDEFRKVYVVTSDGVEQHIVLGNGAFRVPVMELLKQIKEDKAEQHRIIHEYNISNLRSELGRTLPKHIVAKLEQLRK